MRNIIRFLYSTLLFIYILSCTSSKSSTLQNVRVKKITISNKYAIIPNVLKLSLLLEYTKKHYGEPYIYLDNPELIVIHSTETKDLSIALNVFKHDILRGRPDIASGGELNVGTHFLIDTNGNIYLNTPTDYIVRHTIGFNHKAISIENVGYSGNLTKAQIKSNIELIKYLKFKYKSIKYVIGHYEYMDNSKPHFVHFKELSDEYTPTIKMDPGSNFINEIRKGL